MIQGVTLLTALALELTGVAEAVPALPPTLLAASLVTLVWSFGRDIVWQLRAAREGRLRVGSLS